MKTLCLLGCENGRAHARLGRTRTAEFTDGDLCDLTGMTIPLARTRAARIAAGDPRPSLEELSPGHDDYVAKVAAAARALQMQRLMLQEDVDAYIAEAMAAPVPWKTHRT